MKTLLTIVLALLIAAPVQFDKTLTVYTSAQKKPIILHLKGSVTKNAK